MWKIIDNLYLLLQVVYYQMTKVRMRLVAMESQQRPVVRHRWLSCNTDFLGKSRLSYFLPVNGQQVKNVTDTKKRLQWR